MGFLRTTFSRVGTESKKIRENTCQRKHIFWLIIRCVKPNQNREYPSPYEQVARDYNEVNSNWKKTITWRISTWVTPLFTRDLLTKKLQRSVLLNFVLNRLVFPGERDSPDDGSKFLNHLCNKTFWF